MLWQVDLSSEVPIYEQLAASVRREMAAGRLAKGDRLPSARDVAGSLAINLHTVLRAYQELREEGLIELRRGRGAVVLAANAKGEAHVRGMAQVAGHRGPTARAGRPRRAADRGGGAVMRMPPRGQRYVAADWIAVAHRASRLSSVGRLLLVGARDRLPASDRCPVG